jgi:hypothetical protein
MKINPLKKAILFLLALILLSAITNAATLA